MSSPSSSSPSSEKKMYYDVFLSFRGEDCRAKFISHLDSSLQTAGIIVFKDDNGIQRGDRIPDSLMQAIDQSSICIVVLSTNYGNSKWCMMELERILEISRTKGTVVVPVFYEVDPSDVRNQTGKFGEEFDSLISTKNVDKNTEINWKIALQEVGGTAGVVIERSRNESEDIKKIVELVTRLVDMTELSVADHPVGLESRVQEVFQLLNSQKSNDPLLLGIWGMGGIGKTTLAKAIYNKIPRNFYRKCFLFNVGEVWKLDDDKVSFQQRLLSDIYKTTEIKIATVDSGKMILQKRLCDKKIFLVIDDVNELDQLNALCGNRNWFGEGSRIIITTRNEDLLSGLEVDHVYRMMEMDDGESIKLFNWHAFKQPIPREGFTNLSREVVRYSGGLPLALQVIGSFLFTKKTEVEWKSVLEKLKLIPNKEVSEKLRISFDGLSDEDEKDIFLDIAFFFIGMDREDVTEILKDCGHFPEIGISVLVQRSLVTVDRKNKIGMHDLLRDMGREIVRKQSKEGGKEPSRLWRCKDVLHELSKDTVSTLDVKGLTLKMSRLDSPTYLETKAFEKMDKLRLLQLSGVQLDGDYKYLSRHLRWLSWHGFPLKFIPKDFHQENLVSVELKYSTLEQVWMKSQLLVKLKILNLSHSHNLRHTPDFSNLPNLEKLILKDCRSLSSVSSSIGQLKKILLINLKDCTGLRELPKSFYKLESVKTLILSGCTKIDKLEEDIEQMKSLTTLLVDSTDITKTKMYDVFLSFREEDIRANFMSYLNNCLKDAGIYVAPRNYKISISLFQAIGQSRISIVVLSRYYGNSKWCMMELERIVEMSRTNGMVVVPVFYEVDPSQVRHLTGGFGSAFDSLISTTKVDENPQRKWKTALGKVCGRAGFVINNCGNGSADIETIVEHVTRLLDGTQLFVAEHPVGVESRAEAVTTLLNIQNSKDVLLTGIWGMGGTGKTTLAKSIYNKVGRKFEGRSFLLGIREFWETRTNQVSLQQQVLCDVYKSTTWKIRDIESGKNILKEKLAQKKVLLVLDDVNELDQLTALCGSREWFGRGSRIIITTRDMHLLRSCRVDHVYAIKQMDESESLELFSWHAFKQPSPTEDYATHSADVIAYSGGLPLALEVLGSYLSNCEITEWQKVLEKLKCIPYDQVQKKLKVSYDGLKDYTEKQIFLDIACFFIGMEKKDVTEILNGCGFLADTGIKVLVERALLTVDNRNKLRMHDLLRDMGRQIIFEESPSAPEKRSRLWWCDDVLDILSNHKGTKAVKGMALEFPKEVCLETKAFMKMNKLRLLRLAGVKLEGDFKYLSGDLRWLYWHGFPLTYIPAEFQQGSLVAIELKYSKLQKIWNKSQMLENLKILNLSHSLDLTETPNFSYLPNLEKLVLKDCPSLSTVSHSIGSLHKLLLINLTNCTGLQTLPRSIYTLKSLETLILSGCSKIDKLEEDLEQMESLITLIADKTAITKVPFSIVRLKSIGYISLSGFEGFSRDLFPSLIWSWMSPSNNVISLVQSLVSMSSLGTSKDLQKLRILCAECDSDLQLTQYIGRFLDVLKATNCQNLEASASSTASQISDMHASPLIGDRLGHVHTLGSKNHLKSLLIQMGTKCQISNVAEESVFKTADGTWDLFLLICDNKSDWLTFSCKGCSIIFDIPTMKGRNLKSMMLYIVYSSCSENITSEGCRGMLIINYTKTTIHAYKRDTLTSFEDEDWQSITSNLEPGNKVGVTVVFGEGVIVEKTTVSLFYDEPVDKETESCDAVDKEDVIVPGNDNNNVSVFGGDNEAINRLGEETVNQVQVIRHADGLYADVVEAVQLVLPHEPDQLAEAVVGEIPAAEANGDQEQQIPPLEGQPEQQAAAAPEAIGSALGTQILDALRELRADFFRLEQTVTSKWNAVEVRLEVLEDAMAQIPRGSNSEPTDVEN